MRLIGSAIGVLLVALYAIGSGLWVNTGDNWYRSLNSPSWQPPDFIFGLIWPYNFIVLAVAAVRVSQHLNSNLVIAYLSIFAMSVICALTWAYQFYRPHNLIAASTALTAVAVLTIPLLLITFKVSTATFSLLIPYQTWVAIAASLSWGYASLN